MGELCAKYVYVGRTGEALIEEIPRIPPAPGVRPDGLSRATAPRL